MTPENSPETDWPRGCLQIYTGDGKGKTTAALGLALRAAGSGLPVFFGQFLKSRDCGETAGLQRFAGLVIHERFGSGNWPKEGDPHEIACAEWGMERARVALRGKAYRVVVLDELLGALRLKLVTLTQVLELIALRPQQTELILTGRNAPEELIARADLVTEMRALKHYYTAGLPARPGIEY